ncbi:hypothetical protein DSLASN_24570 [Desulfoluna limicola]|uniref:Uncharacterized protein n=1 Tax=Desulfoluna limicola TaxID=2810562 RepID=A0ABM7PGU8_9BACT|nr:hypothetical protein DSLASN_24570 [Desulfoluna limicola]
MNLLDILDRGFSYHGFLYRLFAWLLKGVVRQAVMCPMGGAWSCWEAQVASKRADDTLLDPIQFGVWQRGARGRRAVTLMV